MTLAQDDGSRSLLKILGDSQIAQLLDIAYDLLPEREKFPSAEERNFIDNDEYDFIKVADDQYRLQIKNGATSWDQFDFDEEGLRTFISELEEIRTDDEFVEAAEIGPAITSAVAGPTGPTGPTGPAGIDGIIGGDNVKVVKLEDQEAEDTILQDDAELSFAIGAGQQYQFEIFVFVSIDNSDPDLKMSIGGPDEPDLFIAGFSLLDNTDLTVGPNASGMIITSFGAEVLHYFALATDPVETMVRIAGSVQAGTVDGRVGLQFAQASASSTPVTVRRGSFLVARKT
jgi:hypothetical protein